MPDTTTKDSVSDFVKPNKPDILVITETAASSLKN